MTEQNSTASDVRAAERVIQDDMRARLGNLVREMYALQVEIDLAAERIDSLTAILETQSDNLAGYEEN